MVSDITRLFIVDDHPVVIAGIKNQFRPVRDQIDVTGSASSVEEVISNTIPETFDIFILDLWLDKANPEFGIIALREKFPDKPIIIYTSETSVHWQRRAMKIGVSAYVLKSAVPTEIKTIIRQVASGMIIFPTQVDIEDRKKLILGINGHAKKLTPNQLQLVAHIAGGLTLAEIATKNGTTHSTIEKTLNQVRKICNAKNNAELVSILKDEGAI